MKKVKIWGTPVLMGSVGGLILLMLYFGILSVMNSFNHAVEQFVAMWYWILLLVIGFGVQVGLYSYIRTSIHTKHITGATAEVAAAGGVSTGSMIACCAHHITDLIPIIGLSAAALFLTKYQLTFIVLGVLSNLVGITMMLNIIQKQRLFDNKGFFRNILSYDMGFIRNITIVLSAIILFIVFVIITVPMPTGLVSGGSSNPAYKETFNLPARMNNEGDVTFEITPIDFSFDVPIKFDVAMDTHQGSLDFDLTGISVLRDSFGNEYSPLDWSGSPSGGHHRYGILTFPELKEKSEYIRFIVRDVYGVKERIFVWDLR